VLLVAIGHGVRVQVCGERRIERTRERARARLQSSDGSDSCRAVAVAPTLQIVELADIASVAAAKKGMTKRNKKEAVDQLAELEAQIASMKAMLMAA